ncbi:MAG: glycoside hydrolase family protein, partial [Armatimonadetes bacterium]|nr:glycoside hydrolase family protein [Armatimonadota bacterium]
MPPRDPIYVYRFVNRLVQDLGAQVRYFEVWNEPNIGFFVGRAEDYAAILKAAYLGAKDADPTFGILIGSAAGTPGPFYDQVYDNNVGEYFDIYNQHWYGGPEALFDFLASVREQLAAHGLRKPMWMTEMGMRASPGPDGSYTAVEREQASYLARAYACGFAAGIARFFYFYLQEFLEGSVSLWGIVRDDLTPKPAYAALAALIRQLGTPECLGYRQLDGGYLIVFRRAPGEAVAMVWGREGQQVSLPARGPIVNVVGTEIEAAQPAPGLVLDVGPMPVYVRGIAEADVAALNLTAPAPAPDWTPAADPDLARKHVWIQAQVNPDEPRAFWGGEDRRGALINPNEPFTVAAWVHNYTDQAVTATVTCEPDRVFTLRGPAEAAVEVGPWSRARHDFVLVGRGLVKG